LAAAATCAAMETRHLRCWIAPRDIVAGAEWASSIIGAIENTRVMVLIYTENVNASQQIIREVERAVNKGLPIIPLRIHDTPLSKTFEYYISASHWLDAVGGPTEQDFDRLGKAIDALIAEQPEIRP